MAEGMSALDAPGARSPWADSSESAESGFRAATSSRARALAETELDFVWRLLRRLGLDATDADDGAQDVFVALARRVDDVAVGKERSFLIGTALNVAATHHRARARRRESPETTVEQLVHPGLDPEQAALERRRVELLDQALAELDWEMRVPFVLFELEELTASDIAGLLGIPAGTVASRLRRARELFRSAARRLRARSESGGAP
jgi:RNA polymerase sigma-70 factor (ECF subfamily)